MPESTITEALAEITLIAKKISKKQEKINRYLIRQESFKDPLGDSKKEIDEELQSISDLLSNHIAIRTAIQKANLENRLTIGTFDMSVAEWLIWKREIFPKIQAQFRGIFSIIDEVRSRALKQGATVGSQEVGSPNNFVINVDEKYLSTIMESLQENYDKLDGALSLFNATTRVNW